MIKFAFAFLFVTGGVALPPNFEDVDLAADQPDGEVGIEMVLVENLSPPPAGGGHQPGGPAEQRDPRGAQHPQGQRHHRRADEPFQHHRAHQHERRDWVEGLILVSSNVLLPTAGEGDDDQRAKLAAARQLQRNGEQVGHSPFLAALVPIFLLENLALAHLFG